MRWLVRLYPAGWRERYGEEFEALLADLPATPALVYDVLRGAVDAWSGGSMERRTGVLGDRTTAVVSAGALAAPVVFVIAVWLKYGLGNGALYDPLEPFFTSRFGEVVVVFGPAIALLASAAAVLGLRIDRTDAGREGGAPGGGGGAVAVVSIRLSTLHLALMLTSVALGTLFVLYFVAENL